MHELDTNKQVAAVRTHVGLMDRSETGKIALTGADTFTWLQGMVSNDVRLMTPDNPRLFACVLDATGHLLSDMMLLRMEDSAGKPWVLIDLPRQNVAKIAAIFDRFLITEDVEIEDVSEEWGCFSVQGATSLVWLMEIETDRMFNPVWDNVVLTDVDYTGNGGLNLYYPQEFREPLRLTAPLARLPRIGAEAQEILRVEAGIPKYGADMDETVIALEANLGATHISMTKGCYVGQEIIARIDSRGHTNRALTGLILEPGGELPVPGDRLLAPATGENSAKETGRITSVIASSPAVNGNSIALGYVRHEHRDPGTVLTVASESHERTATVTTLPFYQKGMEF